MPFCRAGIADMGAIVGPSASVEVFPSADYVRLGGVLLNCLTESAVVNHIVTQSQAGEGGWVVTVNVDICRQLRTRAELRSLIQGSTLMVPDGMPLVWASRLMRQPLPERVTGSSLIFSLSGAASAAGRSVYLLGGVHGTPEIAADKLSDLYPELKVAGTDCPPFGFEHDATELTAIRDRLCQAAPDIVYVGLGFPKQERLIASLIPELPSAWFIGCGAAIGFAAGIMNRAPEWMQQSGLEWSHRLISEPRRLFRRYLADLPYAAALLTSSAAARISGMRPSKPGLRGIKKCGNMIERDNLS